MAVQFLIDGSAMPYDPVEVQWEPKEVLDRAHSGAPLRNARRTVRLIMPEMTMSNFATISAYDDASTHTVTIPHPTTGTYTAYAGSYIRVARAPSFLDIHAEEIELEVSWILA